MFAILLLNTSYTGGENVDVGSYENYNVCILEQQNRFSSRHSLSIGNSYGWNNNISVALLSSVKFL